MYSLVFSFLISQDLKLLLMSIWSLGQSKLNIQHLLLCYLLLGKQVMLQLFPSCLLCIASKLIMCWWNCALNCPCWAYQQRHRNLQLEQALESLLVHYTVADHWHDFFATHCEHVEIDALARHQSPIFVQAEHPQMTENVIVACSLNRNKSRICWWMPSGGYRNRRNLRFVFDNVNVCVHKTLRTTDVTTESPLNI